MTDPNRAEEALRKSEERFRRYFELGLIGMAITSPTKGILDVNDEICKILGYERSELCQTTWAALTHPDDLEADVQTFNRVLAGEIEGYSMDKRCIRKNGEVIFTTISVKCVRNDDGSVEYFVALLQDITSRKEAEEALARARAESETRVMERTRQLAAVNEELNKEIVERKQTEGLLREANERVEMVLDSMTDNFFAFDSEWRLTRFNKHGEEQLRTLGKNPASLIGRVLWDEFPDPPVEEAFRRAMRERTVVTHEHYYPPLREWVENRIYPSPDGGLAIFQRYVTERKRGEENLRRSEAYLAEAQKLTHTGSSSWNVSTGEVFWSDETYRIYGFDPGSVEPTYALFFGIVHPDDRVTLEKAFENIVREECKYEMDFRIVRPDGMIRHVHSAGRPLFDESGKLTEIVGTVMDVTERKHAADALWKAQAELARMSRVSTLGAMISSIAHEISQPLAAIATDGSASLKWLDIPDMNEARRAVGRVVDNAFRAGEVINKIRSMAERTSPEEESLSINEIVREVIGLAANELTNAGVVVRTDLQPDLPLVQGDRIQLQQVLLNLILNSNDAMSAPDWPVRELLIRSQEMKPGEVVVSVQDSGPGLGAMDPGRIFDPFFSTKEGGLGLGLWISQSIIQAHGGRIWATQNTDNGTTLQFTLPIPGESRSK
jgi:PAS domain S-box-containing protein